MPKTRSPATIAIAGFLAVESEDTKTLIETETGRNIFKPMEYAFGVSYDCVRHLRKHFSGDEDIADAVEYVFRMIADHDQVIPSVRKDIPKS